MSHERCLQYYYGFVQCVQSICDCKLNPQNYFRCIFHFWYSMTIAKQRLHDRMKENISTGNVRYAEEFHEANRCHVQSKA